MNLLTNVAQITDNANLVETYRAKGWPVVFPLPAGEKKTPPEHMTGRHPDPTAKRVAEVWQGRLDDDGRPVENVGLRMPDTVIAIDVDHSDTKRGAETLSELVEAYGPLPDTYRNTRHGADSKAGHYFFRVPKGTRFATVAGEHIDIVQHGHRYSVVSPSTYEGKVYKWYDLSGSECDVPNVEQLPELPEKWREALKKDRRHSKYDPQDSFAYNEAMRWLEAIAPDFEGTTPAMATKLNAAIEDLAGGAFDTMRDAMFSAIRFATIEGAGGLKGFLSGLEQAYYDEVTQRPLEGRRSPAVARGEWQRALTGAVNGIRGEIEQDGLQTYKATIAKIAKAPGIRAAGAGSSIDEAEEVNKDFADAWKQIHRAMQKSNTDAITRLVALLCGDWYALTAKGENSQLFDLGSRGTVSAQQLRKVLTKEIRPIISAYIDSLDLDLEDDNDLGEFKRLTSIGSHANKLKDQKDLSALVQNINVELEDPQFGRKMPLDKINANPYLIGLGDHVIDLKAVQRAANAEGAEGVAGALDQWLRPATPNDAVTKSLELDSEAARRAVVQMGAEQLEPAAQRLFEAVWPDPEVRRFAQAALGYCLLGENPQDKVFVLHGAGATGKNSVMDTIAALLGKDYFSELKLTEFKTGSASKPDPNYAQSLQTRLTFVDETDDQTVDEAALKLATGRRTGRILYSNKVEASAGNTIVFATNHAFKFHRDSGTDRRLAVIPFTGQPTKITNFWNDVREDEAANDREPWEHRPEELTWILLWLLEGYAMAMSSAKPLAVSNYARPVAEATAAFVDSADDTQDFYKRIQITDDPADEVSAAELVMHYRKILDPEHELKARAIQMEINKWLKDQRYDMNNKRKSPKIVYRCVVFHERPQSTPLKIVPPLSDKAK